MGELGYYVTACEHRVTSEFLGQCWHGPMTGTGNTPLGPVFIGQPAFGPERKPATPTENGENN